jgi:hypothetical protein
MGSTKDATVLALIAAAPELGTPDDTDNFLNAMPIPDLASLWCVLQRLSRRDQTGASWSAILYFDHLPHKRPDRALDLALEVLRSEPDKPTVMQLNGKFMLSLLYAHGAAVIGRIESETKQNAGLRWLLGGIHFGPDEPFKRRIEAIADSKGWRADDLARRTPKRQLDCEAMSVPELARAWIEQYSKSERDRDDNFFAMMDYERDLREERAWFNHSLPEAVIEVKQAAGRLIRTATDSGVLVLADSRLVTKRYGRQFIASLPKSDATLLERANVRRYIGMWRSSRA